MNTKNTEIIFNTVTINIDYKEPIKIGVQPYVDNVQLECLRIDSENKFFFRREKDKIHCISLKSESEPIGNEIIQEKIENRLYLISNLIMNTFRNHFLMSTESEVISSSNEIMRKPLFVIPNKNTNILDKVIPNTSEVYSWFKIQPCFIFEVKVIKPVNKYILVLTCNIKSRISVVIDCKKLIDSGVILTGLYVEAFIKDKNNIIRKKLVGKVKEIKNNNLLLTDNIEGYDSISSEEAFLEPRFENIKYCIEKIFDYETAQRLQKKYEQLRSGEYKLNRAKKMVEFLSLRKEFYITDKIKFSIGDFLEQKQKNTFPKQYFFSKPFFIFDPSGERKDPWGERGIDNHGPYDQVYFTPTKPKIAVICQEKFKGQVEQFLKKFLYGLPNVFVGSNESKRAPYGKGFIKRFNLDGAEVKYFRCEDSTANSYLTQCKIAISEASEHNTKWDLAIVQIEDSFINLSATKNPYLITKSMLLKHHIAVQEVEIETISINDSQLIYVLNNISLASYAKMGGIPWLLQANQTMAHELVFGIGSCLISSGRLGEKEKVVGITTVFTGDGNYMLSNRSSSVSYDEYPNALLNSLKETVKKVREEQNWGEKDPIRLIFHVFKPLKDIEVTAIKKVMIGLNHYDVDYAFVTFSEEHPYYVFDENNYGSKGKGKFAAPRGTGFVLGENELLMTFISSNELKRIEDGIPKPVLMKIHKDSNFKDLGYLARQAFQFSCHSWRMFTPAHLPITILYSRLIADLLTKLNDLPTWDPDSMIGRIGKTRWFL